MPVTAEESPEVYPAATVTVKQQPTEVVGKFDFRHKTRIFTFLLLLCALASLRETQRSNGSFSESVSRKGAKEDAKTQGEQLDRK